MVVVIFILLVILRGFGFITTDTLVIGTILGYICDVCNKVWDIKEGK